MSKARLFTAAWSLIGLGLIGYGLWLIDPKWSLIGVGLLIWVKQWIGRG